MKDNPRDLIDKKVHDLLRDFIDKKTKEQKMMFHIGKIVNNQDPDQQGKCRVRVYGIHGTSDQIPDEDLPWAIPDFNFTGSTLGSFVVPPVDALVNVFFDNGDMYNPRYTTKVLQTSKLTDMASNIGEDYPDTMVFFETDTGEYFKINRRTNTSTYVHASGLTIRIDANGNCEIDSTGSETGNLTINTGNNITVNCGGSADVIVDSDASVTSTKGNVTVEAKIGDIKLGGASATQPVNNLPFCLFTGSPHYTPTMQVPGKSVKVNP